jgi:hypothetical protein
MNQTDRSDFRSSPSNLIQIEETISQQVARERERLEREADILTPSLRHFKRPFERPFTHAQRASTTVVFGGLTWKHETLVQGVLEGLRQQRAMQPDVSPLRGQPVRKLSTTRRRSTQ